MSIDEKLKLLDALSKGDWRIGLMIVEMNNTIYNGKREDPHQGYSNEQIAKALSRIVGKDKPIDCKWKWAGAYWYLRWACNYPADPKAFCLKMDGAEMNIDESLKCDYRNIREITTLSFMSQDATQMDKVVYSKSDEKVFVICREIALKLAEELGKPYFSGA